MHLDDKKAKLPSDWFMQLAGNAVIGWFTWYLLLYDCLITDSCQFVWDEFWVVQILGIVETRKGGRLQAPAVI